MKEHLSISDSELPSIQNLLLIYKQARLLPYGRKKPQTPVSEKLLTSTCNHCLG
jgi:hypothetical protein